MYRERGGIHLTRSSNSLFPTRSNLSLERGEEERSRGASFPKFSTSFYLALERERASAHARCAEKLQRRI